MTAFDVSQIQFPLELRKWSAGDRISPVGLKGSKKVSDLLTDLKTVYSRKETRISAGDGRPNLVGCWLQNGREIRGTRKLE